MSKRKVGLLSVLALASATFLGACAAPAEDASEVGGVDSAAMLGGKRYAEHTFALGEERAFDFKVTAGRLRVIVSAEDPVEGEVASLKTGTTIEVGTLTLLKVSDEGTGAAKVIHTAKVTVRVDSYLLQIVTPDGDAFDRYMLTSGTYRLSAAKLPGASAFSQLDLAVTASW